MTSLMEKKVSIMSTRNASAETNMLPLNVLRAALLGVVLLTGCEEPDPDASAYEADQQAVDEHLAVFDQLDFDVFTHQKWDLLHVSHANDVIVHWPDGRQTNGIDAHIEDLKKLFVHAPDTRIEVHPIKFGVDDWTSVIGVFEGTFTEPMPNGDGSTIPPTGLPFKLMMNTVSHWKDGVMDEEYLFWDNLTYMKQIGLMQ